MKKLMIVAFTMVAAMAVVAAPVKKGKAVKLAAEEPLEEVGGKSVRIDQYPKLGQASCLAAPNVQGGSSFGPAWRGKQRKWIVLEAQYSTLEKCIEQLTFTWHVVLDTKSATENKGNKEKIAPYSYFTQTVTYSNIPRGTHAASVCLHPSYLEQYGEPKAIGLVVTDANGTVLTGNSFSEIHPAIKSGSKFWEDSKVMDAKQPNGEPYVARRQGLQDRSKTIWALVNPNDYELVLQ